ncbi:MAG: helix-turn-helix domain-containing protein [Clostridia bacterium]|nr:helix-turn-helix domain-containing protein [Clostridia bacterium]
MAMDDRLFAYDKIYSGDEMNLPVGKIVQISELSLVAGGVIGDHCQVCDEITYAVSGSADVYSGDNCSTLHSGQIHYIKKGVNHKIVAHPHRNFRYICIGFVPDKGFVVARPFLDSVDSCDYRLWTDDGNVRILSELLVNEVYTADNHSEVMINMYITQILLTLCRDGAVYAPDRHSKNGVFTIYHVLRYIDREYMNIEDIRQISEKLNYSYHYLSHLFSQKMGQSIKEYVTSKKMDEAARLIRSENLTAEQIAERVGYSSGRTFSSAFKKHFGMSIGEYKRKF